MYRSISIAPLPAKRALPNVHTGHVVERWGGHMAKQRGGSRGGKTRVIIYAAFDRRLRETHHKAA